jgi:predicted RNase H-like HicB family nuclease
MAAMTDEHHINIFFSPEDDCWVADLPDFEFCSAMGESPTKALEALMEAKQAWIESAVAAGDPIPPARYRPLLYQHA